MHTSSNNTENNEMSFQTKGGEQSAFTRIFGRDITNVAPIPSGKIAANHRPSSLKEDVLGAFLQSLNEDRLARHPQRLLQAAPSRPRTGISVEKPRENVPAARDPSFVEPRAPQGEPGRMIAEIEIECEPWTGASQDVQCVATYGKDIFDYLREIECKRRAKHGYMRSQTDVNDKMRGILIDWLVDVQVKFKLKAETLFMSVDLIDRFMEKSTIMRQKLQLLGVTSLFIASKYEEIYPPALKDFVLVTDRAYTKEEILEMEGKILLQLDFNLAYPSPLTFLERFSRISKLETKFNHFSSFILELCLVEYQMLQHAPSLLASAAVFLSNKLSGRGDVNASLLVASGYREPQVKPIVHEMLQVLQRSEASSLQAVRRKFSGPKFSEVSRVRVNLLEKRP